MIIDVNDTPEDIKLRNALAIMDGWTIVEAGMDDNHYRCPKWKNPRNSFIEDQPPAYHSSMDVLALAEATAGLHDRQNLELRIRWANTLRDIVAPGCPTNRVGQHVVADIDILLATPRQRAMALASALKLLPWSPVSDKTESK